MYWILFLFFMTSTVMADDVKVIDIDTLTKTTTATVKYADIKAKIAETQKHQDVVRQQMQGVIDQDQAVIDDLTATLTAADQQIAADPTLSAAKAAEAMPSVPMNTKNINWADDQMLNP